MTAAVYRLAAEPRVPAVLEMAMVHMVFTARRGTRDVFVPLHLAFRHTENPRDLPALVQAPVLFEQVEDAVQFRSDCLRLPLRGHNAALHAPSSRRTRRRCSRRCLASATCSIRCAA
jgi:hypothetical protein